MIKNPTLSSDLMCPQAHDPLIKSTLNKITILSFSTRYTISQFFLQLGVVIDKVLAKET